MRNEVCGSELCGLEWELKWWEGGLEKWEWSARKMSRSNYFHEWIEVRNGKRKLTVRRVCESWCVECGSGLRNEWIGAWSFFARCVDRFVWLGVWIGASQALCTCERAASNACERAEWKMFEVKIWAELIFRLFCLILRSNWKYFQFDPIYWT